MMNHDVGGAYKSHGAWLKMEGLEVSASRKGGGAFMPHSAEQEKDFMHETNRLTRPPRGAW